MVFYNLAEKLVGFFPVKEKKTKCFIEMMSERIEWITVCIFLYLLDEFKGRAQKILSTP